MKKILMIIACGAFLAGMFSCSSDPAAAPAVSAEGETFDKALSSEDQVEKGELVMFHPEFLLCNFRVGEYRIDCKVCHEYGSPVWLAARPSWVELMDECEEEGPDNTVFSWCFNVLSNDGIDRCGELNFESKSKEPDGKQFIVPVSQCCDQTKVKIRYLPINIDDPLLYTNSAQRIVITFYLDKAITNVDAYWTASWIHYVYSTPIFYGEEDNIIKMTFDLDRFTFKPDPPTIGQARQGLIRLEYWMNGEKAYFDAVISQSNKFSGKEPL